jgi:hypothetical protein
MEFDTAAELAALQAQTRRIRQVRYRPSRLDRYTGELLSLYQAGASAAELQRWLRARRIKVVLSTVTRWLEKMAKFASAARQATGVIKILQGDILRSVGTVRNYEQGLTRVAEWMKDNRINHGDLRTLTPAQAITYLEQRGEQVGQKTLDMERQAIQAMMIHVTQTLPAGEHLPVVKSEQARILSSRAYSPDQVALIAAAQQPANALATAIALAAGLRAHELLTLAPRQERAPDPRPAADSKFAGREGVIYTVQGKGGLVREVLIPSPWLNVWSMSGWQNRSG